MNKDGLALEARQMDLPGNATLVHISTCGHSSLRPVLTRLQRALAWLGANLGLADSP
jgi:hypothetical protein